MLEMTWKTLHAGFPTPKVDGDSALVPRGSVGRSCQCADRQKGTESRG